MGSQLNPYITFDGTARAAMTYYREVFGGDLEMFDAAPGDAGQTGESRETPKVSHAHLVTPDGFALMGWDAPEGVPYQRGTDVAVYLGGDDERLHELFGRLASDGTVTMALEPQAWGDVAGALVDRFGISWMVNVTAAPA